MPASRTLTVLSLITIALAILLNITRPHAGAPPKMEVYPGDDIIPNPEMLYTHSIPIAAPSGKIFPWILQLGKGRGGWYMPASWERVLPKSMHATRRIHPEWTQLSIGDVVRDYGFNEVEDVFVVERIIDGGNRAGNWEEGMHALVYKSERYGTVFTWTIVVRDLTAANGRGEDQRGSQEQQQSEVTLRFRGRIQRTGLQRSLLVWGGGWMDWATTWPMLRGLRERCEREEDGKGK